MAFEAPAATVLITAHRELEKLTLSATQLTLKEQLARTYGVLVHEGQWLEAAARDIEIFLQSTQRHVNSQSTQVIILTKILHTIIECCGTPLYIRYYGYNTMNIPVISRGSSWIFRI